MDTRSTLKLPEGQSPTPVYAFEKEAPRRQPSKFPKKEGHDALIAALSKRGAMIEMTMLNSETTLTGILRESDRFTITILEGSGDDARIRLIYKHAIESFTLDTNGNVGS